MESEVNAGRLDAVVVAEGPKDASSEAVRLAIPGSENEQDAAYLNPWDESEDSELAAVDNEAASVSSLPAELVIAIANLLPARSIGAMARTCRAWHILLLPYAIANVMPSLSGYGGLLNSLETVKNFVADSQATDKMRRIKSLYLYDPAQAVRFFEGGLIAACHGLQKFSLSIGGNTDSKGAIEKLSSTNFPNLETLSLSVGRLTFTDPFSLQNMPQLKEMTLSGRFNRALISAIDSGLTSLVSIDVNLSFEEDLPRTSLFTSISANPRFLSKITTWTAADPDLLTDLLGVPEFNPTNITQDEASDYRHFLDSENPTLLWTGLVKLASLKHLQCFGLGTRLFLLGFPPNLETISLHTVLPSLHTMLPEFHRVITSLRTSAKDSIFVDVYSESDAPGSTVESMRNWSRELLLWAGATESGENWTVTVDGHTGEEAVAIARRTADFVEEALGEEVVPAQVEGQLEIVVG